VDEIFSEEDITYNAMSMIENEIKTLKTQYNFLEALKVSVNNLKKIKPENDYIGLNISTLIPLVKTIVTFPQ
jgi:hypothetical protein